jgi:uncharacterized membrane protein
MKKNGFQSLLADGIALGLTLAVVGFILFRVIKEIREWIEPIATKLGIERVIGGITITVLTLIVLFLLVIILGGLMRLQFVNRLRDQVESIMLRIFPFLNRFKALVADELHRENATKSWQPVILQKGGEYFLALKTEESEHVGVFYFIKGHNVREGETKIMKKEEYRYVHIDTMDFLALVRGYGEGIGSLIDRQATWS